MQQVLTVAAETNHYEVDTHMHRAFVLYKAWLFFQQLPPVLWWNPDWMSLPVVTLTPALSTHSAKKCCRHMWIQCTPQSKRKIGELLSVQFSSVQHWGSSYLQSQHTVGPEMTEELKRAQQVMSSVTFTWQMTFLFCIHMHWEQFGV